ncbi:MAG: class I SAM-dependent methyltransferase [Methanomassiliicoccaceae archaeon]|nr:class I SAM-dependent methyltransferase [Methanomassiliicoccaceae archaeon]
MSKEHDPVQFRNPVGDEGRSLLEDMNEHHRPLTEWALSKIPDGRRERILDIGCGGGMLISLLSAMHRDAEIYGIDISEESVAMTRKVNAELVDSGRCRVSLDSVSELPFEEGSFDLVTAFETYFFWPDLDDDIVKAAAMVADGGCFVIVSETYPHPMFKERNDEIIRSYGLDLRENDEMTAMLKDCGLSVTVHEIEERNWVVFVGTRVSSRNPTRCGTSVS